MSKSLGNTVVPQKLVDQHGADILRMWVVSSDYTADLRIGPEIINSQVDAYRRLRNTLRFLLGNLNGFDSAERIARDEMPALDRWALHRLWELDRLVRKCVDDFDFHRMYVAIYNFCTVDLSAFYFDVRKDALYCDAANSVRRRAARTVLDELFSRLTAWLAPALCFTAEDAWLARYPDDEGSVHLRLFPEAPEAWRDDALAIRWSKVRELRRVVTGALETERREKRIGASLQAAPTVYAAQDYIDAVEGLDLAELCITSGISLVCGEPPADAFMLDGIAGVGVVPGLAEGAKCQRCWQVLPEVGSADGQGGICRRCADAVAKAPLAEASVAESG